MGYDYALGDRPFYRDLGALPRRPAEFFPLARKHTPAERLNAAVRLVTYVSVALWAYTRRTKFLAWGLALVVLASCLFGLGGGGGGDGPSAFSSTGATAGSGSSRGRSGQAARCTRSTRANPFGNRLPFDDPRRAPACTGDWAEKRLNFERGVPRSAYDVYNATDLPDRFHTMPVTTGVADMDAFRAFAYGDFINTPSCKEDTRYCTRGLEARETAVPYETPGRGFPS